MNMFDNVKLSVLTIPHTFKEACQYVQTAQSNKDKTAFSDEAEFKAAASFAGYRLKKFSHSHWIAYDNANIPRGYFRLIYDFRVDSKLVFT